MDQSYELHVGLIWPLGKEFQIGPSSGDKTRHKNHILMLCEGQAAWACVSNRVKPASPFRP